MKYGCAGVLELLWDYWFPPALNLDGVTLDFLLLDTSIFLPSLLTTMIVFDFLTFCEPVSCLIQTELLDPNGGY